MQEEQPFTSLKPKSSLGGEGEYTPHEVSEKDCEEEESRESASGVHFTDIQDSKVPFMRFDQWDSSKEAIKADDDQKD